MNEMTPLKLIAREFLILTATGFIEEAYSSYVADNFIHHNQYFKGDRESLKQAMLDNAQAMPGKKIDVKSLMQEGDRVISYSHVVMKQGEMEVAVFHMFRFAQEKIVELWDVGQMIAKDGPNQYGPF